MIPAARIAAAIEILQLLETQRRPAADILREWGIAHRFAGSKDRSAISTLVYDALRRRASSAWRMQDENPRGVMIGMLAGGCGEAEIAALFSGEGHAPALLTEVEKTRLREPCDFTQAPASIGGDFPEWLAPYLHRSFGDRLLEEMQALTRRAPIDLRANPLKAPREKAFKMLAHLAPEPTPYAPLGLRIVVEEGARAAALGAEPAYIRGAVEIQDEGSQIVSDLSLARAGEQVLDLCAGGGGKTLALAARMGNRGQIYATDADGRRLSPIFQRMERAGVRNTQVRAPRGQTDILIDLRARCDLVLIDAPCTGIGAWRRNPDAKWRVQPGALEQRCSDQRVILAHGAQYVKPGGRLVYITCSLLKEENEDQAAAFLTEHTDFTLMNARTLANEAGYGELPAHYSEAGMTLTPALTGTDGFYVCAFRRIDE